MCIEVNVIEIYKMPYGTEVDVSYICPHCGEHITETICFDKSIKFCCVNVPDHQCPECGEENDLDVELC